MINTLPQSLIRLAENCPYPLYVVGGRVRDFLAGLNPDKVDTDICAPASAEDFTERAKSCGFIVTACYKNTGTVKIECGEDDFEFTCFRSDEYVRGEHVPTNIFFTQDINLDARRRDFKCNAIYYDIKNRSIVDPLGGVSDIENKRLTTVAPPEKVFGEDGLRLMRLARISAQTGFVPSADCMDAAFKHRKLIQDVSVERVTAELNLILHADERYGMTLGHYKGLKILKDIGVLQILLPELCEGEGMVQRKDFHDYDVLEHSLRCAAYADKSVRLAALLHDVGKPYCMNKYNAFAGHDREGARIAAEICARLKMPKKLTEEVVRLVATHMYDLKCDAKENKVRKFIVENIDIFDKILLIKQADFSACKDNSDTAPSVIKLKNIYAKMVDEGVPFTLRELNVKGNDLIDSGFPPAEVGATLEKLLFDCCINAVENNRQKLIDYACKVYLIRLK
ncbi:MAG: CCA tRNA nucleotidyltransferase [Clostridiales bacterium]|nr:CCA tRNA nucleotidyltransferase [Clostridiales bacterium]